jgi:hypothetical protein
MLNETDETLSWAVTRWLAEFEKAISRFGDKK